MNKLKELLEKNPIIPSVNNMGDLKEAIDTNSDIVFILCGNIINIGNIVKQVKDAGKLIFVNIDLIDGLSNNNTAIQYLKKYTDVDGIISSKAPLLRTAKEYGYYTIHRFFLIDSISYRNLQKLLLISEANCIQILPGWPKVISWLYETINTPIIAGGLVCDKEEVINALKSGAISISTSNTEIWNI